MTNRKAFAYVVLALTAGAVVWLFSKRPRSGTESPMPLVESDTVTNQADANLLNSRGIVSDSFGHSVSDGIETSRPIASTNTPGETAEPLSILLRTGSEGQRRDAALRLRKLGTAKAADLLLTQLEADNPAAVRMSLLNAVSGLVSDETLDLRIACLGNVKKYDVREAVRLSLANSTSPTAFDKLLQAVRQRHDDQWFVRDVAKVFRSYSNPEVNWSLGPRLLASQTYLEAEMCAEALANIGSAEAADALVQAANAFSDERRGVVIRAITHVTRVGALQHLAQGNFDSSATDVTEAIARAVAPLLEPTRSP